MLQAPFTPRCRAPDLHCSGCLTRSRRGSRGHKNRLTRCGCDFRGSSPKPLKPEVVSKLADFHFGCENGTAVAKLKDVKEELYAAGAVYAAMSGSGSTLFGLFDEKPERIAWSQKPVYEVWV